jgi:hypothetical protein
VLHCYQACQEMYHQFDPFLLKYDIPSNTNTRPELLHQANAVLVEEPQDDPDIPVQGIDNSMPGLAVCEHQNDHVDKAIRLTSNETNDQATVDNWELVEQLVLWHSSSAATAFQCRGWNRSDDEWVRKGREIGNKRLDAMILRCAEDPKFRTRLCNHWDVSKGTFCPMRRKNKCIFAHSAVELRVKEAKRHRWGKLVDKDGNHKNVNASGGEDTVGAAKAIELERKQEGKWNTNGQQRGRRLPTENATEVS